MTPTTDNKPPNPSPPPAPKPAVPGGVKNKDLKLPNVKQLFPKLYKKFGKHTVFAAMLIVLLVYILVVFRISQLSNAQPTADQTSNTATLIPKINQGAINQIQSLESNNTQVHTLFEQARNNPFQE
ncbi:MAG: hypothetical protein ACREGG_00290 [Candidatus Saccharimonadales bacterium]